MMTVLTAQERKIKNWMIANVESNLTSSWEASPTMLAEDCAWNSGLVDPKVLDDETHIIWDLAVDVVEAWEELQHESEVS